MPLHPLTKLRLYREARRVVLDLMERDAITPDRADEMLGYVCANAVRLESPEAVQAFAAQLADQYPDLRHVPLKFALEGEETLDEMVKAFVETVFEAGDMALSGEVFAQIASLEEKPDICLKVLQERYPLVYAAAERRLRHE